MEGGRWKVEGGTWKVEGAVEQSSNRAVEQSSGRAIEQSSGRAIISFHVPRSTFHFLRSTFHHRSVLYCDVVGCHFAAGVDFEGVVAAGDLFHIDEVAAVAH